LKSIIRFGKTDEVEWLPLYVTTVGYWEHQTITDRPSGFPDFQFHQILDGRGELVIKENKYIVGPGDVFFLFPGVPHCYTPISHRWELAWVSFNGREASRMLSYSGINGSGVSRLKDESLLYALKEMLSMDDDNGEDADNKRSSLLYALLLDLKRQLLTPSNRDHEMERLRPVLRYIEHNLHGTLTLSELAEVAAVSPQYLCRLFQKTMNMRPMVYINQERINQSKKLMFNKEGKKLYEIAQMVGFDTPSYFCAVFKRYTGMSPEDFNKLHGLI